MKTNNIHPYIKIEKGNCADCYQCIRHCPVNAISYSSGVASIIESKCISCARCIDCCPQNLIGYVSGINKCRNIIKTNDKIVASISPAWVSEFEGFSANKIVECLSLLGFTHVCETTLGVEVVVNEAFKKIKESDDKLYITSVCPVINSLITKRYPHLVDNLISIDTPTVINARQIRQWYGQGTKVITIGGCVAAKNEADSAEGIIAASITFNELKEWLTDEGVNYELMMGHNSYDFEPEKASKYTEYVISGGIFNELKDSEQLISEYELYNVSGLTAVKDTLDKIKEEMFDKPSFVELYACRGGCLYGESAVSRIGQFTKIKNLRNYAAVTAHNHRPTLPLVPCSKQFKAETKTDKISDTLIVETLQSLSLDTTKELINCRACGYGECRDFAAALIRGHADRGMCQWNKRNVSEKTLRNLLSNIPSGVAIVDCNMKIIDTNRNFASAMGTEVLLAYDSYSFLKGIDISRVSPFASFVEKVFKDNTPIIKDIQIKERLIKVIVVPDDTLKRAIIIVRNLFESDVNRDEIVDRTRSVINDNMQTIQQIAYLLGETASKTEAVLNSIIESQTNSDERK